MKIGILSMQKIHNYGSFLQAFSLKMQFEDRGHDVYFIDILPGKQIVSAPEAQSRLSLCSKFDKYVLKRIEHYLLEKKMDRIYSNAQENYLETGKRLADGENFDLAMIGSDEVFNATVPGWWGFSTQLFGDIENARRVVTYAASCGHTTFDAAQKYGIVEELRETMSNLEHISVRDQNTAEFVSCVLDMQPELHVDPVFISDFDQFIPELKRRNPYMLVYAYPNRIYEEKEVAAIKNYAKKHGLDILCVGMQQRWCKHNIPATAFELLAYVKGARCIVTDTFHGTVFSAKYNKRFVSFIRESNRNKLGGLLNQLGLVERAVENIDQLERIMDSEIDYNAVNRVIEQERQKSYGYLDMVTQAEG